MGEYTAIEENAWHIVKGDAPLPGSAEPEEGKCGAVLRNRGVRDVEDFLNVPRGSLTERYCKNPAGSGTRQLGFGPCSTHLGKTPNLTKKYLPMAMSKDLHSLAELWDEPVGIDPAPVEAERLFLKMKKMSLALEQLVLEAGSLDTTSLQGQNHAKAIVEMWERAQDRFADFIKFAMKYELSARRIELEEAQARLLAEAILRVVLDPTLQLTDEQTTQIRINLSKVMDELSPNLRPAWSQDFIDADEG